MIKPLNSSLYPKNLYRSGFISDNLLDANSQEFSSIIVYICSLESESKITSEEAYKQIKKVWIELRHNKPEVWNTENKMYLKN